jgi:ABC-type transport system involved in cytochrome c biogenesis permease component
MEDRVQTRERGKGNNVNTSTARTLLTILMYAGVGIFLLPYAMGKASIAPRLMLLGGLMAVICGLLRCYFTEGE